MPKPLFLALHIFLCAGMCFSQSDILSQGVPSQTSMPDCTDPSQAGSAQCAAAAAQTQPANVGQGRETTSTLPMRTPVLTTPGGVDQDRFAPPTAPKNPSELAQPSAPWHPETEFEQMVADTVGHPLPLFGQSLFVQPPSTFSPVDWMQVPSDYVIGPGDELQIRIWGQVQATLRVIVDRSGQIYVPQVGQIAVAGIHYGDLQEHLKSEISKSFKNFDLTVNIGRLRSIQVLVVGEARYPGTYTISSLSTLVNAVFASGGPGPQGSLRDIEVRRDGTTITNFDFYDLLIKGDKSKDVHLESGDVIYFPHVGPLVAISGSVNTPAIYEIKENSTLNDLIQIAGDLSTLADTDRITIERVVDHNARKTLEFPYDDQSRAEPLKDGDIVRVFSIVPRYVDTVTLRGNVANPGRYPWKPGMRIRDLIPDSQALLTRGYWRYRAGVVSGRATEYPMAAQSPEYNRLENAQAPAATVPSGGERISSNSQNPGTTNNPQVLPEGVSPSAGAASAAGSVYVEGAQGIASSTLPTTGASASNQQLAQTPSNYPYRPPARDVVEDVRRSAPEINWDYAIIQRVNPLDLTSKLLWFSPRKTIIEKDEATNFELQPGDIVTIFSQRDISVPTADRSQYVLVEGEVMRPGVYKLETNETLRSILQRTGGLTPDAYVYGSQLTRESARADQQRSLDELTRTMEVQARQSALSIAAFSAPGDLPQMLAAQQAMINQLRNTRASGRVALAVRPTDKSISDFPNMVMEDGDRLVIPHTPATISVVGDVYNPGSFVFETHNNVGGYLDIAGKGKPQSDLRHAFVLRANGFVVAANNVNGWFTGARFDRIHLYPGDQIVVPYKLPTGAFIRALRDWTQISGQLALTAAALAVVK
jgi:protein involved in polysaccharide export with SLBB domain